jgi:hypothetical protein
MFEPPFEEGRDCRARRFDGGAGLEFCQEPGALDLGLALGAGEGMPAPLALVGLRIAHVDDDGEMAGRPFADVAFHFCSPSSLASSPAKAITWSSLLRISIRFFISRYP